MLLPVYVYGNPILRKTAEEINLKDPSLPQLIKDMFETMYHAHGVGLAAPQIGKAIRIFVIDSEPFKEMYPDVQIKKSAFINPTIDEEFGNDFLFSEGCLSLPEIHEEVLRKSSIKITYWDENGLKHQSEIFSGIVARIIQHEYDHLEGKVFTDRVSPLKKMILKRKLVDIASGKVKPDYKIKN